MKLENNLMNKIHGNNLQTNNLSESRKTLYKDRFS